MHPPISDQLRSETSIVASIAAAVLDEDKLNWCALPGNYELILDHIAVTWLGFTDFNRYCDAPEWFDLDNTAPLSCVLPRRPGLGLKFSDAGLPASLMLQLAGDRAPFTLQTLRSRDQAQILLLWTE